MLVKFTINVGVNDAANLGLQFQQCRTGMELNVRDSVGEKLLAQRFAYEIVDLKAVPPIEIKAAPVVAAEQVKAEPPKPESKPFSKPVEKSPVISSSKGK